MWRKRASEVSLSARKRQFLESELRGWRPQVESLGVMCHGGGDACRTCRSEYEVCSVLQSQPPTSGRWRGRGPGAHASRRARQEAEGRRRPAPPGQSLRAPRPGIGRPAPGSSLHRRPRTLHPMSFTGATAVTAAPANGDGARRRVALSRQKGFGA